MDRRITVPSFALAGVLVAATWLFFAPSPGAETTVSTGANGGNASNTPDSNRALFGMQSSFFTLLAPTASTHSTTPDNESPHKQFEQLVRDYSSGTLTPEEKIGRAHV
jgi:hypothetical protein